MCFTDVDAVPKHHLRPLQSAGSELTLIKILQFGRELKIMNNNLNETQGTNEENNVMLEVSYIGKFSAKLCSDIS